MGGLLHDLGKKKISTSILNFSGVLSDEQFGEIKKAPNYGVEVMECSCCAELDRDLYNDISAVVLDIMKILMALVTLRVKKVMKLTTMPELLLLLIFMMQLHLIEAITIHYLQAMRLS